MVWDKLRQWVGDTAIHGAADGLITAGNVLCGASGAGMSLADVWKTRMEYAYYAQFGLKDNVTLALEVNALHYTMNESIPIDYQDQREGGGSYHFSQWLSPETMQFYSLITFGVGTFSRLSGAYLKKWQQFREEKRWVQDEDKTLAVKPPSVQEISYLTAASVSGALGYFFLGNTVVNALTEYTVLNGKEVTFTYPLSGERLANASLYEGPLFFESIPVAYHAQWEKNISLPWGGTVVATESIDAPGHVSVLGGVTSELFFPKAARGITPLSAAAGTGVYCMHRFFEKKHTERRDQRINEEMIGREEGFHSTDTLPLLEV